MLKIRKESSSESVLKLAEKIYLLDSFFSMFAKNKSITQFLVENRQAVYEEVSYRVLYSTKKEDFGSFDHLVDRATCFVNEKSRKVKNKDDLSRIQLFLETLRDINASRTSVNKMIEMSKKHGTGWIPAEFRRKVTFSLIALPTMFVFYESMRASIIVSLFRSNVEEFTNFILGLYLVIAFFGFLQEQKTLKHKDAVVWNPYSNLLALGLSNEVSGLMSRFPRHITELSAFSSAYLAKTEADIEILVPVLAAILAASIWGGLDIGFNFVQDKIQTRKNTDPVYNLSK